MRRFLIIVLLIILLPVIAVFLRTPEIYTPDTWQPGSIESAEAWGAPTYEPASIEIVLADMVHPESLELGRDGMFYFGTLEGKVWNWQPEAQDAKQIGEVSAQPLSVYPSPDGSVWVAATDDGLVHITDLSAQQVLTRVDDRPLDFANNIALLPDGRILVSQASTKYQMSNHNWDLMESAKHGRIILYDPGAGRSETLVDGVGFANGIEIGGDGEWFLYASSTRHRIDKYWLKGPKKGSSDVFLSNLPGYPDNITRDADGLYWIALASPRVAFIDKSMSKKSFTRQVLGALPRAWLPTGDVTWALAVDETGQLIHSIRAEGTGFGPITSVYHHDGKLYLGHVGGNGIGIIDLAGMEAR